MTNLVRGDQGNGVLGRLIQATNAHDIDAIVACFASGLPERNAGPPNAELHRPRSGATELGADSRFRT